ncbi:MAG: flagellar basal-body rod protein FlgG [Deltaproteobacteria bacterium]|nr:flagellar basal-body rod protein FlgG [Deltaproteobacteria bacterium]
MNRSLWIAATGMEAQQTNIDVISNNLANVNTVGFKKSRADFQDLLYQNIKVPGSASSATSQVPTGIQLGHGVRPVATQKIFNQGSFQQTGNSLDLAIEGDGFFKVTQPDGTTAYTRSGAFKLNSEGQIVTSDGYSLDPSLTIPTDTTSLSISADGILSIRQAGATTTTQVGNIEIGRFVNPAGLQAIGKNLFLETPASGGVIAGTPAQGGFGTITQGYLEMSNVSVVEEMVNMIIAQRAYEINSKAIQTSDEMLQTANNLRR